MFYNKLDELKKMITSRYERRNSNHSELFGSVFFIFVSTLLTALNIYKKAEAAMTLSTSLLVVGFSLAAYLAYKEKTYASRVLIMILCGFIFSVFAVIGGNDGFAILWILLVPVIGSLWIGLKLGCVLSVYFMIFLVMLFYTPLAVYVRGYYSETFMLRFPLLYFASFGAITYLMWQRENLMNKLYRESYYDSLTGMYNRRYYNELSEGIKTGLQDPALVYFSFDLNRLKYANDTFGHQAGDELIKAAASIIGKNFKGAECFRIGGDEFAAFTSGLDPEKAIEDMKRDCAQWRGEFMEEMSISVGYATAADHPDLNFDELAALSDADMYEDKKRFYMNSGADRRRAYLSYTYINSGDV